MRNIDVVLINPGDKNQMYQSLGKEISAVEPPYLLVALAEYLRNKGVNSGVIDANAESLSPEETAVRVAQMNPFFALVFVYGSQPSASTQNMTISGRICKAISDLKSCKVALGGMHPSALPHQTLKEEAVDFVIQGEGYDGTLQLVEALKHGRQDLSAVPGLWYRQDGEIRNNHPAELTRDIDRLFSAAAWDLMSMPSYRAHNWHCLNDLESRQPYAAIYTSLGCPYSCLFCCINVPFGKPGIRYRSPARVVEEIDLLVRKYGVRNIKIIDELFVLDESHYMKIVDLLLERSYQLNIWAYARVDTIKLNNLRKMKQAGINWLALGIESADSQVRTGVHKGYGNKNVEQLVKDLQQTGISVMGNFIFGLPDDNLHTMEETFALAVRCNCDYVNFYCAMAYPGSKLYEIARQQGWELPAVWHGYSQHSYECLPLPTKYLSAKEVLEFRDDAFTRYFRRRNYLEAIENKFGHQAKRHIEAMAEKKLKRKLLKKNGL